MKKFFVLIAIAISLSTATQAQDEGKITLDLNFQPAAFFDAAASDMFSMPYIKARYFISSDMAVRLGLGVNFSNNKDYAGVSDDYTKTSSLGFTLAPGIEKHFGSEKFFAYIGAEIPFYTRSSKTEDKFGTTTVITNNENNSGYTGFGLNIVFGADFYVFKNFYVGAELTPGLSILKYKDEKTAGAVTEKGSSSTDFSLAASSGLRIGFRF